MFVGVDGIFLEFARFGRRVVTSFEAIDRFGNALAEARRQGRSSRPALRRSHCQRESQIQAAEQRLAAKGI
jgi:hypothetical protein